MELQIHVFIILIEFYYKILTIYMVIFAVLENVSTKTK